MVPFIFLCIRSIYLIAPSVPNARTADRKNGKSVLTQKATMALS